jgi:hypothetical protein
LINAVPFPPGLETTNASLSIPDWPMRLSSATPCRGGLRCATNSPNTSIVLACLEADRQPRRESLQPLNSSPRHLHSLHLGSFLFLTASIVLSYTETTLVRHSPQLLSFVLVLALQSLHSYPFNLDAPQSRGHAGALQTS